MRRIGRFIDFIYRHDMEFFGVMVVVVLLVSVLGF